MKPKEITKRLSELEEKARANRDKWDDTPLSTWLEGEDEEEYEKLMKLWNREDYDELTEIMEEKLEQMENGKNTR